nr:MAG TPA: hypothetical protein [Caudoviricetes sp.]
MIDIFVFFFKILNNFSSSYLRAIVVNPAYPLFPDIY